MPSIAKISRGRGIHSESFIKTPKALIGNVLFSKAEPGLRLEIIISVIALRPRYMCGGIKILQLCRFEHADTHRFRAGSQPYDGMPNGDSRRRTRNIERIERIFAAAKVANARNTTTKRR